MAEIAAAAHDKAWKDACSKLYAQFGQSFGAENCTSSDGESLCGTTKDKPITPELKKEAHDVSPKSGTQQGNREQDCSGRVNWLQRERDRILAEDIVEQHGDINCIDEPVVANCRLCESVKPFEC